MSRRQSNQAQPATSAAPNLRAAGCGLVCLALTGRISGATNDTDIVSRQLAELADLSLEQLMEIQVPTVVGASKHAQKVTEAPASVTIVTRDDIQKFGYRNMADIIRGVPGFYVTQDGSYGFIGVNGFSRPGDYGGRVLMMIDGHRINDPLYDTAPPLNDFVLNVNMIERVELIRGPGSSLYGNNAFFAVINVITRRASDFQWGEVSGSAGSEDTYQTTVTLGHEFTNGVALVLSGSFADSHGDDRVDVPGYGTVKNADDEQFYNLFGSVSFRGFTVEGGYVNHQKQVPNALYEAAFGDPRYNVTDDHGFADAKWVHECENGLELLARAYYDYYAFQGNYPYDYAAPGDPPDIVLNRDDQTAQSAGAEIQATKTLFEKHRVTVGTEFRDDFELRMRNYDVNPPANYLDTDESAYVLSVYAQNEFRALTNLLLSAGVRYDYYDSFGSTVNPRAAVIYDPLAGTTLKFIYGSAYRAPNAYERFYTSNLNSANGDLQPETINSFQTIWEQAIGQNLRTSLMGFYNETQDLISQTTDSGTGNDIYDNLDSAIAYGAEAQLNAYWTSGWRAGVSYSFTETEDTTTNQRLDNSPQHLVKSSLVAPVYRDQVFAGLQAQYTSSRNTPASGSLSGYWLLNATLFAHKFWGGWEASASLYNILNQRYSDPTDSIPETVQQDGRQFRVKLTYRF